MRYVARNRPFVIRNGAKDWKARKRWSAAYLSSVMAAQTVNVALTPHGNADSVVRTPDGAHIFVKPHERDESFEAVLRAIQRQELDESFAGPTRYAQTQNDNLRNEYETLFADVPKSIPFAKIALAQEPDAVNFWLGNSHSVTALHKDNYENVYVQILGRKHFVLLPPVEAPCVAERSVLACRARSWGFASTIPRNMSRLRRGILMRRQRTRRRIRSIRSRCVSRWKRVICYISLRCGITK
jgi:jumonji domain-containing protein 7